MSQSQSNRLRIAGIIFMIAALGLSFTSETVAAFVSFMWGFAAWFWGTLNEPRKTS